MSKFDEYLTRLVREYDFDRKIQFVIAGGGVSISRLALVPGSSRVIEEIRVLYSESCSSKYLENGGILIPEDAIVSLVSKWMAENLYQVASNLNGRDRIIAITAALTTSRNRRGLNRAFIRTSRSVCHELLLDKLSDAVYKDTVIPWRDQQIANKREAEDELIAEVALKLGTGFEAESLEGVLSNGTLRSV